MYKVIVIVLPDCLAGQVGVSFPVLFNSKPFFSLLSGSIKNYMLIKYRRVSEQEVGAKGPGPALANCSIWVGESTPVDLDL
jgi:hypothetical protein